jgi:hypothetical protein
MASTVRVPGTGSASAAKFDLVWVVKKKKKKRKQRKKKKEKRRFSLSFW